MVAYEFYVRDNSHGDRLIGILPERRKRLDRITDESIFRWASKVFNTMVDLRKVYFVSVTVQQNGRGFYFPEPRGRRKPNEMEKGGTPAASAPSSPSSGDEER